MELSNGSGQSSSPILILNACPDVQLRGVRAKILNDAGYYTSSASTPDEASRLSARMNCALAVVCYSFSETEQQTIHDRLQEQSPATRFILLDHVADEDPKGFLVKIRKALYKLEIVKPERRA